ncbi:putative membrane protein [Pseudomonas fluorescens]|uniref:Putative membrane protein n=1 Tax=Pseudomonas fluorescens TaxID=294 RepID=A0A0P8X541_PSEFL|nr:hypothetical protein [Pseudomonas fluorescens]KPU61204.1 putative membrane protein [Pseudomonas fluorescens]
MSRNMVFSFVIASVSLAWLLTLILPVIAPPSSLPVHYEQTQAQQHAAWISMLFGYGHLTTWRVMLKKLSP